jgi:hypothetical protein
MTFDHRKPDDIDFQRKLPIDLLTLEASWEPQVYCDDHGKTVIGTLDGDELQRPRDLVDC